MTRHVNFVSMDVQITREELARKILHELSESMVQRIVQMVKREQGTSTNQPQPMSIEELEARLTQSAKDIEQNNVHSTQQIRDHFKLG